MQPICLSYSKDDGAEAKALGLWLLENGWTEALIDDGASGEAIRRCEAVIFLVSRGWLADEERRAGYWRSRSLGKAVFCVIVDALPIEDLPSGMSVSGRVFALAPDDEASMVRSFEADRAVTFSIRGLDALRAALVQTRVNARFFAWPPQNEPDRAPYRGLEALDAVDAGVFFGRDAELVEALDALRSLAAGGPGRLFIVAGEAGAGKSSFLRAGLAPRLGCDDASFLFLPVIRSTEGGLFGPGGLAEAISDAARRRGRPLPDTDIREAIAAGGESFRRLLEDLTSRTAAERDIGASPPTLVIAIDQAESLLCDNDESRRLAALIAGLASEDRPAVIIVLAMRLSDYGALQREKLFAGFRPCLFALPSMSRDAYRSVIEGPAGRLPPAGRMEIEPALVEALLDDLDESGDDPLARLAFALQSLYRLCAYDRIIRKADYEKCGRLAGMIDAAAGRVLAIAGADPGAPRDRDARLALLRRGLIPWLACNVPGSGTARRRRARMREIPLDSLPLIELLAEERLVTRGVDRPGDEPTFELAHDILLDRWKQLRDWLAEEPALDETMEKLKRAASEWDAHGRSAEWAKHAGALLQKAESIYAKPEFLARLDAVDRAYLIACRERQKSTPRTDVSHPPEELQIPEEERVARKSDYSLRNSRRTRRLEALAWTGLATTLVAAGLAGWLWRSPPETGRDATAKLMQSEATLAAAINSINRSLDGLAKKLAGETESQASLLVDAFDDLLKLQQQLADYNAQSEDLRRSQSVALNHISEVFLAKGDTEAARAAARRSVAVMGALSSSRPQDAGWRRDLSVSYEKLGDAQAAAGDLAGARKSYGDDLEIARSLSTAAPRDAQRRWDMSVSYEKLGDVQLAQGDLKGALESYGDARAVREALTTENPGVQNWRRGLAVSYEKIGIALAKRQETKQAIAAFEGALEIYQTLTRANPADPQTTVYAVVPHWWLADLDKPKAREHLDAALAILQPLAESGRLSDDKRKWMAQIKAARGALDEASSAKR
ncbi:AAA family ATPase [Methylocystis sp. IM3]|uniref:ATP-binding protein n=2 Tax=Methylocystis TaxID=133 RepID=UPI0031194DEF